MQRNGGVDKANGQIREEEGYIRQKTLQVFFMHLFCFFF